MYNRAKFYAALTAYLLSDFPFLRTRPVQARDLSENELRTLTLERYRCTYLVSLKRSFSFPPPPRSIQLNPATVDPPP